MSDYHVLTNGDGTWRIAMHFPVPNTNNSVGVNHRTALVNSGIGVGEDGRRTVLTSGTGAGQITTAEEALLDSGELFEHVGSFRIESGGTSDPDRIASLDEFYNATKSSIQQRVGERLRYFGFTRDIP